MDIGELIVWARSEASRLRDFDVSSMPASKRATSGDLAPAVEFLNRFGKSTPMFAKQAEVLVRNPNDAWAHADDMAALLSSWADFLEAGLADVLPFEVRARVEAATDLLEQVQALLEDTTTHVAAPIVLIGAALEEFLRSLALRHSIQNSSPGSITKYANALRSAEVISAQDVKNVIAWAGLRNLAAHGNFDDLDRREARIVFQGVNLFMQQHS